VPIWNILSYQLFNPQFEPRTVKRQKTNPFIAPIEQAQSSLVCKVYLVDSKNLVNRWRRVVVPSSTYCQAVVDIIVESFSIPRMYVHVYVVAAWLLLELSFEKRKVLNAHPRFMPRGSSLINVCSKVGPQRYASRTLRLNESNESIVMVSTEKRKTCYACTLL
jgi:hypothetical protein